MTHRFSRRTLLGASVGTGVGAAVMGDASRAAPLASASALFGDVETYERFGDHRTGGPADQHTSRWIARRLSTAGMTATLHPFVHDVFALERATMRTDGDTFDLFPAWPARAVHNLQGPLALPRSDTALEAGAIAFVRLAYAPNATLAAPGYRAPLEAAARARAAAIVAATEGPTGEIIALNADLSARIASIPILLAAGRDAARLEAAAQLGVRARLDVTGIDTAHGQAFNVIGYRPGVGRALVISTPSSGWFRCAGERGAGVAIFLALAGWAMGAVPNPLAFVATSGHEFEGLGSAHLFEALALKPEDTALWVHLGANVASRTVTLDNGRVTGADTPSLPRYAGATSDLLAQAAEAFAGQPGYSTPFDIATQRALGDLALYYGQGFHHILGLLGASPLHHTRLDTAANGVLPGELETTTGSLRRFISAVLGLS